MSLNLRLDGVEAGLEGSGGGVCELGAWLRLGGDKGGAMSG